MGRGNDPNIDLDRILTANPCNLALLDGAKQRDLAVRAEISDFIEEEGAALSQFKFARTLPMRPGECALLMPEQLTFEQPIGDRPAIKCDKRPVAAGAVPMEK